MLNYYSSRIAAVSLREGFAPYRGGYRQSVDSSQVLNRVKVLPMIAEVRSSVRVKRERQAVLAVARMRESRRRESVRQAIEVLTALVAPVESKPTTVLQALESRYSVLRRERREYEAVMQYLPFDGRPPHCGAVSTVNGSNSPRVSEPWRGTGRRGAIAASLTPEAFECRRSFDSGATWEPFSGRAVEDEGKRSNRRKVSAQTAAQRDVALMERLDVRPASEDDGS